MTNIEKVHSKLSKSNLMCKIRHQLLESNVRKEPIGNVHRYFMKNYPEYGSAFSHCPSKYNYFLRIIAKYFLNEGSFKILIKDPKRSDELKSLVSIANTYKVSLRIGKNNPFLRYKEYKIDNTHRNSTKKPIDNRLQLIYEAKLKEIDLLTKQLEAIKLVEELM